MIFFQVGGIFFLAVFNFHDPELTVITYIRITLSELFDQQFKIGNVLK
jgi:hypothetical protein